MPKFNKRTLQRVRVPLGFIFAVLFIVFSRPTLWTLVAGGVIAVLGLAVRAWASGHIRKASVLAVSGPYAYTRNPLYLGSLLLGVGFTVAAGVWWLALAFTALYLGIYLPVMRVEEEDIRRIFGTEFDEYQKAVPLFIPRLSVWKRTATRFDGQLYLRYREYRAALGAAGAMAILGAKAYFFG
ncbi:MAG TPA: isoprenylcysteine carboxylmethyltransferase family protein [Pyrinomonadaceae bacterium]|jgi:protein-S-isoprenylcysteine O-methyltransferase Ste14|nr:isoprenylcysteine carboxylmethyltransferase family protein [Pyrinomonadaceae bacterium]